MAMKHLVNLHYLFTLAGVNAVWNYLQHEFLNIRERRSIIGGHLSAKVPVYWVLFLRVFLGIKWLKEGLKKVSEGWLDPGVGGIFDVDLSKIYLPGVDFMATGATSGASPDAATAASAAADGAAAASEYGEPILKEALGIYNWVAANILGAHPTIAFLSQSGVVLAQLAVGICLILGLFTFPAALVSIAMGVMFIISGWGNVELWWYLTAAIVMLGGAGKGLGLDHYVMPALKRWWNGTRLAKKTWLYIDEPRLK